MTLEERVAELTEDQVWAIIKQERPRDVWHGDVFDEVAFLDLLIWHQGGVELAIQTNKKSVHGI